MKTLSELKYGMFVHPRVKEMDEKRAGLQVVAFLLPDVVLPEEASEFPLLEVEVRRGSGPCTLAVTLGSTSHSVEVAVHYVP